MHKSLHHQFFLLSQYFQILVHHHTIISLKTELLPRSINLKLFENKPGNRKICHLLLLLEQHIKTYNLQSMKNHSCVSFLLVSTSIIFFVIVQPQFYYSYITAKNIKGQTWFNVKGFLRWSKAFQNSPSKEQAKITHRLCKRSAFLLTQLYHLNPAKGTNS